VRPAFYLSFALAAALLQAGVPAQADWSCARATAGWSCSGVALADPHPHAASAVDAVETAPAADAPDTGEPPPPPEALVGTAAPGTVLPETGRRLAYFAPARPPTEERMWALCQPWPPLIVPLEPEPLPHTPVEVVPVQLFANHALLSAERDAQFRGDVVLLRDGQQLEADEMDYDATANEVRARGDVRYWQEGFAAAGDSAHLDLDTDQGEMETATYRLEERHARGRAERVLVEGPERARLSRVSYTTCDPGRRDWELRAREVRLNRATGTGNARHVTVAFQGVPFLYSPYLSFPLDNRRKSGFLTPSVGSSSTTGFDLQVPYYWNIAPHRDATITPRFMADRGVQLIGEFRYLNPANRGIVGAEYLPGDRVAERDRHAFFLRHSGVLAPRWTTNIDVNHVSDSQYLQDFGDSLSVASITHVERRADVQYHGGVWNVLGRVQGFQTVDEEIPGPARPYQRLPQLLVRGALPPTAYGVTPALRAEYVNFERADSVTGGRLDLRPSLSLPLTGLAYFLTPTLSLRHTQYQLDGTPPEEPSNPSRTVPSVSLDGGIFLERDAQWGDRPLLHTLEPRLFYLYVPRVDQDELPVFDTGRFGFGFAQLFAEDRFTGADRVGDANQLTLALTSRLIDGPTGAERLSAGIGQILYFRDREVTLPNEAVATERTSDLLGQLGLRLHPSWTGDATVQWNPHEDRVEVGTAALRFRPGRSRIVNLAYRFRHDSLEQTDVSFLWPLGPQWRLVGRWNYSLRESRNLETLAGVEFESCCWGARLAVREYLLDAEGNTDLGVYLQLELKGLTSVGQNVENLLEHGILGYEVR
jgi:LPS-assembly protein